MISIVIICMHVYISLPLFLYYIIRGAQCWWKTPQVKTWGVEISTRLPTLSQLDTGDQVAASYPPRGLSCWENSVPNYARIIYGVPPCNALPPLTTSHSINGWYCDDKSFHRGTFISLGWCGVLYGFVHLVRNCYR